MATKSSTTQSTTPPPVEGQLVHTEIVTKDPKALMTLMTKVFDWEFKTSKMADGSEYHSFTTPGGIGGGVTAPPVPEQPIGSTPYILVGDIKAAQKKVEKAGATIVVPAMEIPGVGWFFQFQVKGAPVLACFQAKMG